MPSSLVSYTTTVSSRRMPSSDMAAANSLGPGSMCGYGDRRSMTLSRSKKRALGMRCLRNDWMPVRASASLGRNQAAQRGDDAGLGVDRRWRGSS